MKQLCEALGEDRSRDADPKRWLKTG
jgi:hypothetical protein